MKDLEERKLQSFFRMLFNGMITDFDKLYAIFNVFGVGYFRVPVNISNYFYIVKYGGIRNSNDINLYSVRKFKFHAKMNIISMNEPNVLNDQSELECKMSSCVLSNYEVHDDSFLIGVRRTPEGVMLTSFFLLEKLAYYGNTCYNSFKDWVKLDRKNSFEVMKCYFCITAFRNQNLAMF